MNWYKLYHWNSCEFEHIVLYMNENAFNWRDIPTSNCAMFKIETIQILSVHCVYTFKHVKTANPVTINKFLIRYVVFKLRPYDLWATQDTIRREFEVTGTEICLCSKISLFYSAQFHSQKLNWQSSELYIKYIISLIMLELHISSFCISYKNQA